MMPHAARHRRARTAPPGRRLRGRGRRRATAHGTWRRPARLGTLGPSFELKLARWPKSDGMISATATAARNTRSAAWPVTRPPPVPPVGLPTVADQVIREELIDLVLLGRPALSNPHWPVWAARELAHNDPFSLIPRDWSWWLRNRPGPEGSLGWPTTSAG